MSIFPKKLKILPADDVTDERLFFRKALQELPVDFHLTTVNNGDGLMVFLNNDLTELPDVLFLDINLPLKSGTECLEELKQNPKPENLPLIMFSTLNSACAIKMLFNKGADVYIHKPNEFAKLKQVIYHALPISKDINFAATQIKYILNA